MANILELSTNISVLIVTQQATTKEHVHNDLNTYMYVCVCTQHITDYALVCDRYMFNKLCYISGGHYSTQLEYRHFR